MSDNSKRGAGELSKAFPAVLCAPDVAAHPCRSCQHPDLPQLLRSPPSFSRCGSDLSSHQCSRTAPTPCDGAVPGRSTAHKCGGSPSDPGGFSCVVRTASAPIERPYNAPLPSARPESPQCCWPKYCYSRPASAGSCYDPPSRVRPVCRRVDVEPLSIVNGDAALSASPAAIARRFGLGRERPNVFRLQQRSRGAHSSGPSASTPGIGSENRVTSCCVDNSYVFPHSTLTFATFLPWSSFVARIVFRTDSALR
jgi:hypothetical protein